MRNSGTDETWIEAVTSIRLVAIRKANRTPMRAVIEGANSRLAAWGERLQTRTQEGLGIKVLALLFALLVVTAFSQSGQPSSIQQGVFIMQCVTVLWRRLAKLYTTTGKISVGVVRLVQWRGIRKGMGCLPHQEKGELA